MKQLGSQRNSRSVRNDPAGPGLAAARCARGEPASRPRGDLHRPGSIRKNAARVDHRRQGHRPLGSGRHTRSTRRRDPGTLRRRRSGRDRPRRARRPAQPRLPARGPAPRTSPPRHRRLGPRGRDLPRQPRAAAPAGPGRNNAPFRIRGRCDPGRRPLRGVRERARLVRRGRFGPPAGSARPRRRGGSIR